MRDISFDPQQDPQRTPGSVRIYSYGRKHLPRAAYSIAPRGRRKIKKQIPLANIAAARLD